MAENINEKIVITVDYDFKEADKKILALRKAQNDLKKEQDDLKKAYKEGAISADDYAKRSLELEKQMKLNTTAQQQTNKETQLATKINQTAKDSIVGMQLEVSQLTAKYFAMSKAERENTDEGRALGKQIKELNANINEQKQAVGNNTSNIGNYTQSILEAAKGNKLVATSLEFVNKGFNLLLANPVGLAIAAIVLIFTKLASATDFVKDKVEQFTAGFGAAFDVLVNALQGFFTSADKFKGFGDLVGGVFDIIKIPIQNFIDLIVGVSKGLFALATGDFEGVKKAGTETFDKLKTNAQNFSTAVDKTTEAGRGLVKGITELGAAAAKAAVEQAKLTERLQDLEDLENANSVAVAKANAQSQLALIAIKNRNTSEAEKIKLLDAAGAAEQKAANVSLDIARQRLEISQKELEIRKQNGVNIDAQNEAVQKAEIALTNATAENANIQEKISNRRVQLIEQEAAARKKAADEAFAVAQKNAERQAQLIVDELKKSLALFDVKAKGEIKAAREAGENLTLLQQVQAQERQKIIIDFAKKRLDEFNKEVEDEAKIFEEAGKADLAAREKRFNDALKVIDDFNTEQKTAFTNQRAVGEISEQEYQNKLIALNTQGLNAQKKLLELYGKDITKINEQIAEDNLKSARKELAQKKAIESAKYSVAKSSLNALSSLTTIALGEGEKAKEAQKILAIAQIAISTAKAITALTASASEVAAAVAEASGPAGIVTGPVAYAAYYATQIATILANVAQAKSILSQAGGGGDFVTTKPTMLLVGESGPERINVTPLTPGGKTIINPESGLLQMGGGGSLTKVDNGIASQNIVQSVSQPLDINALAGALSKTPIFVKVSDINKVQNQVKVTESKTDI